MAGKFGVCMIHSPILHTRPQRQPEVDMAVYHVIFNDCTAADLFLHLKHIPFIGIHSVFLSLCFCSFYSKNRDPLLVDKL